MVDHASYPERLKWAAEQGSKNLGEKFTTGDNMNKEAQTTLTYVLAAMGATFAYVFSALPSELTLFVAVAAVMCAYYTGFGIYLVRKTFVIGDFPSPYQQPANLIRDPQVSLDDVLKAEIRDIEKRITEAETWISAKSNAINNVRLALVLSPLGFIACALFIKCTKLL